MDSRVLLLFVFSFLCINTQAQLNVKHLAGPPSEFDDNIPLSPLDFPDIQNSATIKVKLAQHHDKNVLSKTVPLMVDSKKEFRFAMFAPVLSDIQIVLVDSMGKHVAYDQAPTFIPIGELQIPGTVYLVNNPVQGEYKLHLKTSSLSDEQYASVSSNSREDVFIIMWNEDPLAMHTTLNTFNTVVGNQIGLVTSVMNSNLASSSRAPLKHTLNATMSVTLPDGKSQEIPMNDDGLSADGAASDGVYGALITASVAGQYSFEATVRGVNAKGLQYVRSTTHVVTVVPQSLTLSGTATVVTDSPMRVVAQIAVSAPVNQKYYAYAEVWGTDSNGNEVRVSWIGGMTYVQSSGDDTFIPVELDLNWVSMAGALEPLFLRNIMIQDPGYFVPIAQYAEIPLKTTFELEDLMTSQKLKGPNDEITEEMLSGRRPPSNISAEDADPTVYLVLVHGYCSGTNPFSGSGTWTNGKFFLKPNANMLNDVFATSIDSWAKGANLQAYSYIGHSQGGMAGAHLKNFYWSGLDYVKGGKVIQTLGTPFSGCSAAGTAANLGSLFGVSCGANDNLTPNGATLWLQRITTPTRACCSTYTTTYAQGQTFGDYCNLGMNMLLSFPNDGTTEYDRALLTGATNMGNTQRWCHITDMKYPAQYTDGTRNAAMNSNAARTYTIPA